MAVQQMAVTPVANLVEARRLRRIATVATGFAIEAILIVSIVLSTIGVAPGVGPTPGGAAPVPAPAAAP